MQNNADSVIAVFNVFCVFCFTWKKNSLGCGGVVV